MAAAPAKPKGGGILKAKIGPVPVPLILAAVAAIGVYLYLRHRANSAPTSAGSTSTPTTDSSLYPQVPDSTGGGSGGLDLSSLLDALQQQQSDFLASLSTAQAGGAALPTAGGGNVSPPVIASSPSQPLTTFTGGGVSPPAPEYSPPDYGPEAGYTPGGQETLSGSIVTLPTTSNGLVSPGGGTYTSGGGVVTYQSGKGKYGKKPVQ